MGKISTHLTLEETTASSWARRNGVDNSCKDPDHLENLKWIAKNIYDPIKTNFPNMILEIAYRTPAVNKGVGGSANSQHMVGEAIDIDDRLERNAENKKVFEWVVKNLNFDQIIWEFGDATGPAWLHISCKRGNVGNRKKVTRAIKEGTKTKYIPFK